MVKGAKNRQYQSPSLASNEIFYLDCKGNPKPNIFRSSSAQSSPEKAMKRASICSTQSLNCEVRTQFLL